MKRFAIILASVLMTLPIILLAQSKATIELKEGWKFLPGDSIQYAQPGYDDSKWVPIKVNSYWENHGYEELDGFAWYRIKFVLPSMLKDSERIQYGVRIFLGKIDDTEQTFLNGKLIGINGKLIENKHLKEDVSYWDTDRCYILPVDDKQLLWDRENVIAVRVFDVGGAGGMYSIGSKNIRMMCVDDYFEYDNSARPFELNQNEYKKTFSLKNTLEKDVIRGELSILANGKLTNTELYRDNIKVELQPQSIQEIAIAIKRIDESAIVKYEFTFVDDNRRKLWQEETPYVLTPKPSLFPKINGAYVYGQRPDKPLLYTIAVTGQRPIMFKAQGLPKGLSLDHSNGIISGRVKNKGVYKIKLIAMNSKGTDSKEFKLVIGDQIALTPPLGWNSWNCWGLTVDEDKVLASARVFKEKGLLDHGWTYINIDDGWEIFGNSDQPKRNADETILTNEKFKNMKALGDSIHALGMKFGIYSSPGPLTCGGYTASYQYEKNDAKSFADWGVDYLKYDWCSSGGIAKGTTRAKLIAPYALMRKELDEVDRDIVYSLCQYGEGNVWEWGADVGGNLWRTTGDIRDRWDSMSEIGFSQIENAPYAGPGHWNDPDMLVVGWVGSWGTNMNPTGLTPDEQYTHISLWCLLSAPLLIGCDLERLDEFTLNLLTNDEVIAIDQDPLGKQATPKIKNGNIQVWVKELEDGGKAIGIFNLGADSERFTLNLAQLGFNGNIAMRDVWRQKCLGKFKGKYEAHVSSHGVVLLRTD